MLLNGRFAAQFVSRVVCVALPRVLTLPTVIVWCVIAVVGSSPGIVTAQPPGARGAPVPDEIASYLKVIAFEAQPRMITATDFGRLLFVGNPYSRLSEQETLNDAERIRGVVALPPDFEVFWSRASSFRGPRSELVPLNIYIQVTWKNSGKFNKFREEVEKRMNPEEIGGVKHYPGLLLPMPAKMVLGDQQVDLFTSAYSYHPQGLPFISPGAERLLKSAPRADAVAVIDIGGARSFVDSGLALTRELVPPNVMEQVEMVSNIESVVAYATFGRDLELKLDIESIGQTEAAELLEVAEQLIKLAKSAVAQSAYPDPIADEFVESLSAHRSGRQLELTARLTGQTLERLEQSRAEGIIANNQRQILLSAHNFYDANKGFPFQAGLGRHPELSWRVRVLPFLDEMDLYREFDLNEPWDSPNNKRLLDRIPAMLGSDDGMTNICWIQSEVRTAADFTRKMGDTICLLATSKYVPWTSNNDLTPAEAMVEFLSLKPGEFLYATMYDGRVRKITAEMDPAEFEEMLYPMRDK